MSGSLADQSVTHVTPAGIPIRNLWHMLLYAWGEVRLLGQWRSDVESAPSLDALLATMLMHLFDQRLRIGLGRDYRSDSRALRGIRGRINFPMSLRTLAFEHGQAHCRFTTYSANVRKNQIIRSTMSRLARTGEFGNDPTTDLELRHRLRFHVRELDGVDLIQLKPDIIRRQQQERDDRDYQLMLSICHLIAEGNMPTEESGSVTGRGLDRDSMILWRVFERFIASFFKHHLTEWAVHPQRQLKWPIAGEPNGLIPTLNPDIVLRHRATQRHVILDTKFTAKLLVPGAYGQERVNRNHLFQIYAYLRSQEDRSPAHEHSTGVLLYPSVNQQIAEAIELQGHKIRWDTVDLTKSWIEIEHALLELAASWASDDS